MWTEPETEPHAQTANALPPHSHVVSQGVRHVPIDILPRDVLTFRTICGQDVTEDEPTPEETRECAWCRRFEWP